MGAEAGRHRALRVAVAALVCVDLLRMGVEITLLNAPEYLGYGGRFASGLEAYLSHTVWVIAALSAVGTLRWARWRSTLGGAFALVGLSALCLIHSYLRGEHDESLFYAGILLAGWLISEALASHRESEDEPSEWGARGALAFLAGSYVAAGLSKAGSASWWEGENLRLALAMATDIYPDSIWVGLRQWMADATWLTPPLSALTVAIELGGVLLLAGPRVRMWAGAALWCVHVGIFIGLGVLFPEPLIVLPLMTWPWHTRVPAAAALVSTTPRQSGWSESVMAIAALCAAGGLWLGATSPAPVFAGLYGPVPVHAIAHPAPAGPAPAGDATPTGAPWDRWLAKAALNQAQDSRTGGLASLYRAATHDSPEARSLWDCDAGRVTEGRPGGDRFGCMVHLPGTYLRQLLHNPPSKTAEVDPHTFLMGAQATDPSAPGYDPEADTDEGPPHPVTLSPFWLQRTTVSVRQYRLCVAFGPCDEAEVATGGYFTYSPAPKMATSTIVSDGDERPITGVTWEGARAYCEWVGGRLPTEAEWEFAARGGPLELRYPWGDEDPTCRHAIFGGGSERICGVTGPASSGSRLTDGHRTHSFILQQAGNVWEWTQDWYAPDYYAQAPANDPKGPESGQGRVQRGGSWSDDDPHALRGTFRAQMDPTLKMPDVGFRCAADAVQSRPYTLLEDFESGGLGPWGPVSADAGARWTVARSLLTVAAGDSGATARFVPGPVSSPTLLSVRAFPEMGPGGSISVLYGVQDADNHYRADLFVQAGVARLIRVLDGTEGVIAEATGLKVPNNWLVLNVTWAGGQHAFNFGGVAMAPKRAHEVTGEERTWSQGGYGLRVTGTGSATIDSIFTTP